MHLTPVETAPRPTHMQQTWKAVATHTHFLRSHKTDFEGAKDVVVAWCQQHGIEAVGVGSPWEPVSAGHYGHYERVERDLYYSGQVDPKRVMDREAIDAFFADMNGRTGGQPLFYQDNENPKGRYGHLWWFGYHYDFPAWHDYSQDGSVQYTPTQDGTLNRLTGKPHRRRAYLEIVASQRVQGALGIWAHPTSWWFDGQGGFVTNIAAELPFHFWADGRLDGLVVMGYDNCHRWYQRLWFALLDTGAIVPGFAETDHCFDHEDLLEEAAALKSYLYLPTAITGEAIRDAAKTGRCCMSTGAFLELSVDGTPMGRVLESGARETHTVRIEAYPRQGESQFSRLDLIGKGGRILASYENFPGGRLEYTLEGQDGPHYVLALAYGETDDPEAERMQDIHHMAISNPVYLQPRGFALKPMNTECTLRLGADNPYAGGTIQFQDAGGKTLEQGTLTAGETRITLPASARVQIGQEGQDDLWFHIALENQRLRPHIEYLAGGGFLQDWPDKRPGQVPVEAFRLAETREALTQADFDLDRIAQANARTVHSGS